MILELVHLVGWNKNHIAWIKRPVVFAIKELSLAFEDKDFVFPWVFMQWAVTRWFDFKNSHGKVGCAHFLCYEPSNFDFFSSLDFCVFEFDGVITKSLRVLATALGF